MWDTRKDEWGKEDGRQSLPLTVGGGARIDAQRLSGKTFFADLLAEGARQGMLDAADAGRIQAESLELLAESVKLLCGEKSSSVRVEKAQELLGSIFYTVGTALKEFAEPEAALRTLRERPLAELFQQGQHILRRRLLAANVMQQQLKKDLFRTPNVFYRATIVEGINGFFKLYRPALFAQETHITADYPVFLPQDDLCGVEFIETYLQKLTCENRFCRLFAPERIHALLRGLDENYAQIPLNLYEPVLTAALCCVLTGQPAQELICDRGVLRCLLNDKSKREIETLLREALPLLLAELRSAADSSESPERQASRAQAAFLHAQSETARYLQESLPPLAGTLFRAMQHDCLDKAVLLPRL